MSAPRWLQTLEHPLDRDVLFVCTGNICRSPLAAALLRQARPDLRVSSSGLGAVVGAGMDDVPASFARMRGADPSHVARQFSVTEANGSALVLVMERAQRDRVLDEAPRLLRRTFQLQELLVATAHVSDPVPVPELARIAAAHRSAARDAPDVPDPYRRSEATHRAVADALAAAIESFAARIAL